MSELLGGYYGDDADDDEDKRAQDIASQDRKLEPAHQASFMEAVAQGLREHNEQLIKITNKYNHLFQQNTAITVGIKRLESLINSGFRFDFNKLRDAYNLLNNKSSSLIFELDRCHNLIKETTTAYQFASNTFDSNLADKHKKIAMQKETQLRLQDIENQLNVCRTLVEDLASVSQSLKDHVSSILDKAGAKLEPDVRNKMQKEDQLKQIILQQQKHFRKQPPFTTSLTPKRVSSATTVNGYGDDTASNNLFTSMAAFSIGIASVVLLNKCWK